ncbi:MAG: Fe-S cluster assembly sulfur transfer protein SufU [Bacteroidota bacterium]
MNERLKKLYQEVIVRHSREPYHFSKDAVGEMIEAYNPLCGDQYKLYVDRIDDKLQSLHFHGYGCSISKAASSVLVQSMEGLDLASAKEKVASFMAVLNPEIELENLPIPEEYLAFEAARSFPARLKCASLAWETMAKYLENLP